MEHPEYQIHDHLHGKVIINKPNDHPLFSIVFLLGLSEQPQIYTEKYVAHKAAFKQDLLKDYPYRLLFLAGEERKVTKKYSFNETNVLRCWYDVNDLEVNQIDRYCYDHIEYSLQIAKQVIKQEMEIHQNQTNKVFLGGFSQGCCLSLQLSLQAEYQLGSVIVTGGIILPKLFQQIANGQCQVQNQKFIFHLGEDDQIYKKQYFVECFDKFKQLFEGDMQTIIESNAGHKVTQQFWDILQNRIIQQIN